MITQKTLKKVLKYKKKKGIFIWKKRVSSHVYKNDIAGSYNKLGYLEIRLNKKLYLGHRLAWLYKKGYFSEYEIDHKDKNSSNNKWKKLRETSRQCNARNSKLSKSNTSGITGITWYKRDNIWSVRIMVSYKNLHLGYFKDFTEGVAHRLAAEQCLNWNKCNEDSSAFRYIKEYCNG